MTSISDYISHSLAAYPVLKGVDAFLWVCIETQTLYICKQTHIEHQYPISTALLGSGNRANSNQTPLGLHSIAEKHGENVPLGGILSSRVYTGELAEIHHDAVLRETDLITTRILWLKGEEPGLNQGEEIDSFARYIYLHGTPEEGMLGKPASHGCIRLSNPAISFLFETVAVGTYVLIVERCANFQNSVEC